MAIDALATVAASCVTIESKGSLGSGTVIAHVGVNSYVLSCAHIVPNAKAPVTVCTWIKGRWTKVPGKVERLDEDSDLSLIRTSRRIDVEPLILAAASPDLYERVFACGSASRLHGIGAEGVLSGKKGSCRDVDVNHLIYTGLSTHGMSGGPLANDDGDLIGVISAVDMNGHLPVWSIGYAVCIEHVKKFLSPETVKKFARATKKAPTRMRRK